jgi:hypothetical protein
MTTTPLPVEAPAPSLFALAGEAMALQRQISELAEGLHTEDGDLNTDTAGALEALLLSEAGNREALQRKADAYCWVIAQLRAQAAYRRAESDRLRDLADVDARRADALQERLLAALAGIDPDATRWSLPAHELTSRRTESVAIDPDAELPPEFLRERRTYAPDKTALKAALKAGQAVPGAELVTGRSWSIR